MGIPRFVKRKWNRQGKLFEYEWSRSMREFEKTHSNFFGRRLYDYKDFMKINIKMKVPHQPADFYAVYDSKPYFFECKSGSNPTRYNRNYVKPEQIESMVKLFGCGAKVFIIFRRMGVHAEPAAWLMPINKWVFILTTVDAVGIPWSVIDQHGIKLESHLNEDNKVYYDLTPVFTYES